MVSMMQQTPTTTGTKVQVHHTHQSTSSKNTQVLSNDDQTGVNYDPTSSPGNAAAKPPPRVQRRIADVEICESNNVPMEPTNSSRYTPRTPNIQKSNANTLSSSNYDSRVLRSKICTEDVTDVPAWSQIDDSLPSSPYLPPSPGRMPVLRNRLFNNHNTARQKIQALITTESVDQDQSMARVETQEHDPSTPTKSKSKRRQGEDFEDIVGGGTFVGGRINDVANRVDDLVIESIEGEDDAVDEEEYEVERIVGEKIGKGIHEYLIQWMGYEELNWISAADCFCPDLIVEFRSVQRVGLVEAALAGREAEAERLRKLANAARIEAETSPELSKPVTSSRTRRDPKTGRFVKKAIQIKRPRIATVEMGIDGPTESPDSERDESYSIPRDARANTARLPGNRPVASVWDTRRDTETGEIIWIRRARGGGKEATLENRDGNQYALEKAKAEAGAKERHESIKAWMTNVAEMEGAEMERRRMEDAEEEVRKERPKMALENQKVEEHLRELQKGELRRKELERRNLALRRLEEEELEKRALERKGMEDREASRNLELSREHCQGRSSTVLKDDLAEAQKLRTKSQKQKLQKTLANASTEKLAKSLRMALAVDVNKRRGERSSSSMRRSEQADQLRISRDREARVKNSICPSLVRSEFRKSMSTKHAEALINLTKECPESARNSFGLTALRNTLNANQ